MFNGAFLCVCVCARAFFCFFSLIRLSRTFRVFPRTILKFSRWWIPKLQFWYPPLRFGSQHPDAQTPICLGFSWVCTADFGFSAGRQQTFAYFPEVPVAKMRVSAPAPYKNPTAMCSATSQKGPNRPRKQPQPSRVSD